MFAGLIDALAGYKTAAVGMVLLALLAAVGVQTVRLDHTELKSEVLVANAATLQAKLDAQNAGIEAVRAVAAAQQEAALKAAKAAHKALATSEAKAARIEAAMVPQTCPDAIQFLVDDAKGAQ